MTPGGYLFLAAVDSVDDISHLFELEHFDGFFALKKIDRSSF